MTAEAGHEPNRFYVDEAGNPNLNGATFFGLTAADVSGLGTAATQASSAFDAAGSAATAQSAAESYADSGDATTLTAAEAYTDAHTGPPKYSDANQVIDSGNHLIDDPANTPSIAGSGAAIALAGSNDAAGQIYAACGAGSFAAGSVTLATVTLAHPFATNIFPVVSIADGSPATDQSGAVYCVRTANESGSGFDIVLVSANGFGSYTNLYVNYSVRGV